MAASSRTSLSLVFFFSYLLQPIPAARRAQMVQTMIVVQEIRSQMSEDRRQKSGGGLRGALSENEPGDDTHKKKADNLDRHVGCCVNAGEAVPVPIGNVGGDGGKNS